MASPADGGTLLAYLIENDMLPYEGLRCRGHYEPVACGRLLDVRACAALSMACTQLRKLHSHMLMRILNETEGLRDTKFIFNNNNSSSSRGVSTTAADSGAEAVAREALGRHFLRAGVHERTIFHFVEELCVTAVEFTKVLYLSKQHNFEMLIEDEAAALMNAQNPDSFRELKEKTERLRELIRDEGEHLALLMSRISHPDIFSSFLGRTYALNALQHMLGSAFHDSCADAVSTASAVRSFSAGAYIFDTYDECLDRNVADRHKRLLESIMNNSTAGLFLNVTNSSQNRWGPLCRPRVFYDEEQAFPLIKDSAGKSKEIAFRITLSGFHQYAHALQNEFQLHSRRVGARHVREKMKILHEIPTLKRIIAEHTRTPWHRSLLDNPFYAGAPDKYFIGGTMEYYFISPDWDDERGNCEQHGDTEMPDDRHQLELWGNEIRRKQRLSLMPDMIANHNWSGFHQLLDSP